MGCWDLVCTPQRRWLPRARENYPTPSSCCGSRPAATQRSYEMDVLRWLRFLWAVEIGWDQATRMEASLLGRNVRVTRSDGKPRTLRMMVGDNSEIELV